jgi:hypothetical protein
MTTLGGDASFRDYRNAIDGQIEAGLTLEQVEDFIDVCSVDDEQKAALWLWAWLHGPSGAWRKSAEPHRQRLARAESG